MFWRKKADPEPLGVPLGLLQAVLAQTSIKASLVENALIARHEHYTTRVEVLPAAAKDSIDRSIWADGDLAPQMQSLLAKNSTDRPIRAVVRVVADLPRQVEALFKGKADGALVDMNMFAALGALYRDGDRVRVGSRLTIYEGEDASGPLQFPVLMFTVIGGVEAILGAMRRTLTQQAARGGESDWGEQDLAQVANQLSKSCACTVEGLNLSVEFPLVKGAASAAGGDRETALFQLMADQPHPEVGGGLCCLLQMPQQVADKELLAGICSQLNRMEMAAADLAPHFGAWCPGKLGNNPAYVSFLPNALHGAPGLAEHTALCAMRRAAWAHQAIAAIRALC